MEREGAGGGHGEGHGEGERGRHRVDDWAPSQLLVTDIYEDMRQRGKNGDAGLHSYINRLLL